MIRRLWRERGFEEPTPPQEKAIPLILSGENVLIAAPTGSGKTEAAFLPILSMMLEVREPGIKLLYVTPLRTLNRDILSRLEWWTLRLGLRIAFRHGDTSRSERRIQALAPPDVMVTTPETLQLLIVGRRLREHLRALRWVIVDEVHEVADSKRGAQLSLLMEKVRMLASREPQVIGLSATIGNPEEVAKLLVGVGRRCKVVYVPAHKRIEVTVAWPDVRKDDVELAQALLVSPEVAARLRFIRGLVGRYRSTLIFSNTRPTAEMLASRFKLWDERFPIYVHHGSLSQPERVRVEEMLRRGEIRGVVCTSSMELGIDIGHVDFVVQYNSPREVRRLIQRVGRSGHSLRRVSRGVIVVGCSDDALESIVLKRRLEGGLIEPSRPPPKPLDVLAHELVGYAIAWGGSLEEFYERARRAEPFKDLSFDELVEVARFMEELGLLRVLEGRLRPGGRRSYDYFYGTLSTIPEVKQYYVVERESGDLVGLLDDYFVSEYCEPGARFIMAGRPWEVISLTEEVVYVSPADDYESAVPSWVGEEIPVPFEVAQEVGRLRGLAAEEARRGAPLPEAAKKIAETYGVDPGVVEKAFKPVYDAVSRGFPVPSDKLIVAEDAGDVVVVHAHFGNRVNRALGKYLSYRAARRLGIPAYASEKPYRIVIRCEGLEAGEVAEMLAGVSEEEFMRYIRAAVEDSRAFRWRLQQVARRMGVIAPGARLTVGDVEKLVAALKGTPAYTEALKEVMYRDMDVEGALRVVAWLRRGLLRVVVSKGPSPLTLEAIKSLRAGLEPTAPERRELVSYVLFKVKLLQSFISFCCTECGAVFTLPLAEVGLGTLCPYCGSDSLAFDTVTEEEMTTRASRCLKSKRGRGCRSFWASVRLFQKYREAAVLARAAGFSFREISELLSGYSGSRDSLLRLLWARRREKLQARLAGIDATP